MIDTISGAKATAIIYNIVETAKANNLKLYEYFEYLLSVIPEHMEDTDIKFLKDLLPWSEVLPENIQIINFDTTSLAARVNRSTHYGALTNQVLFTYFLLYANISIIDI